VLGERRHRQSEMLTRGSTLANRAHICVRKTKLGACARTNAANLLICCGARAGERTIAEAPKRRRSTHPMSSRRMGRDAAPIAPRSHATPSNKVAARQLRLSRRRSAIVGRRACQIPGSKPSASGGPARASAPGGPTRYATVIRPRASHRVSAWPRGRQLAFGAMRYAGGVRNAARGRNEALF
jgi:hypothetical protein